MKPIIIVLLSLFTATSGFSSTTTPNSGQLEQAVQKQLDKTLSFPEAAAEQNLQGAVYVSFTVTPEGELIINDLESTSDVLGQYVETKLQTLDLSALQLEQAKAFHYRFTFKREG